MINEWIDNNDKPVTMIANLHYRRRDVHKNMNKCMCFVWIRLVFLGLHGHRYYTPLHIINAATCNHAGFYLFLIMMVIPLLFFALIASVHGRIQVITHVIGLIYVVSVYVSGTQHHASIFSCYICSYIASYIASYI